eukprot:scaffold10253_cov124-Isochrysis_galbana.AAC.10
MDKSLDEIIAGDRPARVAVKGSKSGAPGFKSSESFKQPGGGRGGGWGAGQVMYFPSGTPGHKSPNCPQIGRGGGGRGSGATFKCFNCGGVGHTSADCPTPSLKGTAAAMGGEKVCYAFRKGKCLKGDACTFAHIAAPADARGKIAMRRKRSIRVDGNDTITSLEGVDVVRISDKDITLDTGGDGSQLTLDVMNDALEPYGFTVKPHPRDESWQVPRHSSRHKHSAPLPLPSRARAVAPSHRVFVPSFWPALSLLPTPGRCRMARRRWCDCTTAWSSRAPLSSPHSRTRPWGRVWARAAGAGAARASSASIGTRRTEGEGSAPPHLGLPLHASPGRSSPGLVRAPPLTIHATVRLSRSSVLGKGGDGPIAG